MTHKDAPPETASQVACREFWQKAQPHITRAWGRAKDGTYLAESSRLLHKAWEEAAKGAGEVHWFIARDEQGVFYGTNRRTRRGAIAEFEKTMDMPWADLRKAGFKAFKCRVVPL